MGQGAESTVCGLGMPGSFVPSGVFSDRAVFFYRRAWDRSRKESFYDEDRARDLDLLELAQAGTQDP